MPQFILLILISNNGKKLQTDQRSLTMYMKNDFTEMFCLNLYMQNKGGVKQSHCQLQILLAFLISNNFGKTDALF